MHQNLQSTVVLPTEVFEVRDDAQPKNQLERPGAKEGDVNLGSWFPGRSSSQNGKNRGRGTDDNVFFSDLLEAFSEKHIDGKSCNCARDVGAQQPSLSGLRFGKSAPPKRV